MLQQAYEDEGKSTANILGRRKDLKKTRKMSVTLYEAVTHSPAGPMKMMKRSDIWFVQIDE